MGTSKAVLGEEYPSTLANTANFSSTYWSQERWKEAEELETKVKETPKTVLGEENPDALTSVANLVLTLKGQDCTVGTVPPLDT